MKIQFNAHVKNIMNIKNSDNQFPQILFLMGSGDYSPFHKNIDIFQRSGAFARVIAFKRPNVLGKDRTGKYELLGTIRDGFYLRRLIPYLLAVPKTRRALKNKDCLYVFGPDMLLLGLLSSIGPGKRPKIFYEIHDIRDILVENNYLGRILRTLEKIMIRKVDIVIVTSRAYISEYYKKILGIRKKAFFVLENKMDPLLFRDTSFVGEGHSDKITIGYFGSLRCNISWKLLRNLIAQAGEMFSVYLRGVPKGLSDFQDVIQNSGSIKYGGIYDNPEDLAYIYSQVDIIWAAGFNSKKTYAWSRTCRFYEACLFQKPLIALSNTEDGKIVEKYGIGICVDLNDPTDAIDKIRNISREKILTWQKNIRSIDKSVYLYSNEHQEILDKIKL